MANWNQRIEKHGQLTSDGAVIIMIQIACDPLPDTEDFQEALAGAGQPKTGAGAEGGIDSTVVCDGISHTYTVPWVLTATLAHQEQLAAFLR